MKGIIFTVVAIVLVACTLGGCRWKSFVSETQGLAGNVIDVTSPMVLTKDYTNTVFHVRGTTLDLNKHIISGKDKKGRKFNPIILHDNGKVTNGSIVDSYIGVIHADDLSPSDVLLMKGMKRADARKYADENLTPNASGGQVTSGIVFKRINKGVYVQNFVHDSVIRNNFFQDIDKMAVYLDSGSHGTKVIKNIFNGCGEVGIIGINKRECISVDASYDNEIKDNGFSNCHGFACIAMYVNCGEKGLPRPYDSNNNRIIDNSFRGKTTSIIVGSRVNNRGGWMHSCGGYDYPEIVGRTVIKGNKNATVVDNGIDTIIE